MIITEPNFNSILGSEINSYGVAYPIPHTPTTIYAQRTVDLDSNVLRNLVSFVQF